MVETIFSFQVFGGKHFYLFLESKPHGKHLPLDKQAIFLDELINAYLKEVGVSPDSLGAVHWGEYVLIVEGKRN
ncbi:MAG: hypothetical protein JSR80_07265 [Verrucomicrobia bacterium]|nr:hypothetical protein [Verrucomicrobiota bacterium]